MVVLKSLSTTKPLEYYKYNYYIDIIFISNKIKEDNYSECVI